MGIYIVTPELSSHSNLPDISATLPHESVFQMPNLLRVVLSNGAAFLLSLSSSIIFLRFFKRITAPQMLFLFIFFFSLTFELTKVFSLLLNIFDASEGTILFLSRLGFGGYLVGFFSMFLISLYQLGIKYQHQGIVLILILFISAFLAFVIPINTNTLSPNFLYPPAYRTQILRMVAGITAVVLIGSVLPQPFNRKEFARIISVFFLIAGQSLLYFSSTSLPAFSGVGLVLCGIVIYFLRLFRDFFWY